MLVSSGGLSGPLGFLAPDLDDIFLLSRSRDSLTTPTV